MPASPSIQTTLEAADKTASPIETTSVKIKIVNWSAIFFALLQSVCSLFIALSGLRLLIGLGAFTAAMGALRIADRLHADQIRVPMTVIALLGATWNLVALWRIWSLRRRSASLWRRQPVSRPKRRSEFLQLGISVATLVLLFFEAIAHYHLFRHL